MLSDASYGTLSDEVSRTETDYGTPPPGVVREWEVCIFPEENPVEWNTLDREETLQVDALGNETTPFITDQEAYYARKMDT